MATQLSFIHPSYRDLVIEELRQEIEERRSFLQTASLNGIKLAISDSGGSHGNLVFPLLKSSEDWTRLTTRCRELIQSISEKDLVDLLRVVTSAAISQQRHIDIKSLRTVIGEICAGCRTRWNHEQTIISNDELTAYYAASVVGFPLPPSPELDATWNYRVDMVKEWLTHNPLHSPPEEIVFTEWIHLVDVIAQQESRFLLYIGFPNYFSELISESLAWVEAALDDDGAFTALDVDDTEVERLEAFAGLLQRVAGLIPGTLERATDLAGSLYGLAMEMNKRLEELADERKREDQESAFELDDLKISKADSTVSIDRIFTDL